MMEENFRFFLMGLASFALLITPIIITGYALIYRFFCQLSQSKIYEMEALLKNADRFAEAYSSPDFKQVVENLVVINLVQEQDRFETRLRDDKLLKTSYWLNKLLSWPEVNYWPAITDLADKVKEYRFFMQINEPSAHGEIESM